MTQNDKIGIFLHDCRVQLLVGVYERESHAPQNVTISIDAETSLTEHFSDPAEKNIARIVSYETLYRFVKDELPLLGHIYLLESVAEAIIAFCFRDPRLQRVTVRLEKTDVFPDAVAGITMTRTNPHMDQS